MRTGKEETMAETKALQFNIQEQLTSVVNTMVSVITNPAAFYQNMPRTGGFNDPIIFVAAMGLVGGVLQLILSVFGLSIAGSFLMALGYLILFPVFYALFSFIPAAILYMIWKVMGSRENFEIAYRCTAYAAAIGPIITIIGLIPYLGVIVANAWIAYLLVMASVEAHDLIAKPCWIVFGVIAGVLSLGSVTTQYTARQYVKELYKMEQMTPEEAGKKVGEFIKGMQQGAGKQ
jgi:hypothetical protein